MSEEQKLIEWIEAWLRDEMTPEEKVQFEDRLQKDKTFKEAVLSYKKLVEGIKYVGTKEMEKNLSKARKKLEKENFFNKTDKIINMENSKKSAKWISWAVAAAAVIVLGIVLFNVFTPEKQSIEEAFVQYNLPETELLPEILDRLEAPGMADPDKLTNDTLIYALKLYEGTKYKEARVTLSSYLLGYPEDEIANLYMGLSLFHIEEYGKAAEYFSKLMEVDEDDIRHTAKWYLALSYSTFGSKSAETKAKKLLEQIAGENSQYQAEAKGFLNFF